MVTTLLCQTPTTHLYSPVASNQNKHIEERNKRESSVNSDFQNSKISRGPGRDAKLTHFLLSLSPSPPFCSVLVGLSVQRGLTLSKNGTRNVLVSNCEPSPTAPVPGGDAVQALETDFGSCLLKYSKKCD